jgi:hypothetical protein
MSSESVTLRTPLQLSEPDLDAIGSGDASDEVVQRFRLLSPWRHMPGVTRGLETVADLLLAFPSQDIAEKVQIARHASTRETMGGGFDVAKGIHEVRESALASGDITQLLNLIQQGTERRTRHLVRGICHNRGPVGSTLQLHDGTSLTIWLTDGIAPADQEDIWAVVQLRPPRNGLGTGAELAAWRSATGEQWLPNYLGHTLAERFVRSYLCAILSQAINLPDSAPAGLRTALLSIHAPWSRETAEQAVHMEFREAVADALRQLLTAAPVMPKPRLIRTHRQAEEYAAEMMRALGYADAVPTPRGSDGGVDVRSQWAVAQVKMEGVPTGRPTLQAIAGIARVDAVDAIFFSLAGYTAQALDWAELAEIACFEFAFDGSIQPRGTRARKILENGRPPTR